jgi:hypothetical protein
MHELLNNLGVSFTIMWNKVGLKLRPCFTPIWDLKNRVVPLSNFNTEELTEEYIY